MKPFFIAFAVVALSAAGVAAQTPPPTTSPQSGQSVTPSESSPSDASLTSGTVINAKLDSNVDSKKAKAGTQITADTTEAVKSNDGRAVLPKGTKLIGHVTEATSKDAGGNQSTLAIQFDKAKLKNGQEMSLTGVQIQALAAPGREASAYGTDTERSTQPNTSPGAPANNPSMAGTRGARPEGTTPSQNTEPFPTSSEQSTGTASAQGEANNAGPLPASSRGVYGIQGVSIVSARSDQGTVLTSTNKNVHLDSGTRLLLVVQPQNGAGSGR
jgi:hypothetical protein